jgi:hypothetical protein
MPIPSFESLATSFELLIAGGLLLLCAAAMLLARRNPHVEVDHSPVTDQLMVGLERIASALEGLRGPSQDEITRNVLVRLHEIANAKPNGKVREMPIGSGSFPHK